MSVDQLKSSAPGLIGQIKGWLTMRGNTLQQCLLIIIQISLLSMSHQATLPWKQLKPRKAFERFASSHNVIVKHYHADNGRFADTLFKEHVQEKGNH